MAKSRPNSIKAPSTKPKRKTPEKKSGKETALHKAESGEHTSTIFAKPRRVIAASLLAAAGLSSAIASNTSKKTFVPDTYQPPEEGKIIYRLSKPEASKTIIYIPDWHSRPSDSSDNTTGKKSQEETFKIVEDAIKRYGPTSAVLEQWTDFSDQTYKKNFATDFPEILLPLAATPESDAKSATAFQTLKSKELPAGPILAATFPQSLKALPSHSKDQEKLYTYVGSTFISISDLLNTPTSKCSSVPGIRSTDTISNAINRFESNNGTPESTACFCTLHTLSNEAYEQFMNVRTHVAAEEEVKRAVQSTTPFTFIIAGNFHLPAAINELKKHPINIIVVSPKTTEAASRATLETPPSIEPIMPDDQNKTCAKWKAANPESIQKSRAILKQKITDHVNQILHE